MRKPLGKPQSTKRVAEPLPSDPSSFSCSSKSRPNRDIGSDGARVSDDEGGGGNNSNVGVGGGGDNGNGSDGGSGLYVITSVQKAFHFLEGPGDVLSASLACRRWRELACAGSVWKVKTEREGILEKAAAFEVEVPMAVSEASLNEDQETAAMAFYVSVFILKVRCRLLDGGGFPLVSVSPLLAPFAFATAAVQGYKMTSSLRDDSLRDEHPGRIRAAVRAWFEEPAAAKAMYGPIASWDTSEVTNMDWLFHNRADFNEDISRWDVGQVKSTNSMFRGATSFNGDLSRWDVREVRNMTHMFKGATSFNGDLSRWDVGQVRNMDNMFCCATLFNGDLSSWDVGQVGRMTSMFENATSFNGDISSWDVGQVETMTYMFENATSFNRRLDGAWSTITTTRVTGIFLNSPGSIAGMTKVVYH